MSYENCEETIVSNVYCDLQEDPAGENEICICQRIVSDTIADGTEYIQTCGRCEERGEDVLLDPESKREDREDVRLSI